MPSSLPCRIRLAAIDDCRAIEAIAQAAYAPYLDRMENKPFPMLDDYGAHIRQQRVHVLEAGGCIRGYVVLIPEAGSLLLDNIAVHPQWQGAGWGRCLALYAEERGRQWGCRRIRLYTNEAMVENLAWYPRLGYRISHRAVEQGYRRVYLVKDLQRDERPDP